MQSAAQTVHIPEKGEMFSGVLILVFVMELPAGGLYVTMKTSYFFLTRYILEKKSCLHGVGTLFSHRVPTFPAKGAKRDFLTFPQYIPGRIFFNSGEHA
jgi:hypothetical protein